MDYSVLTRAAVGGVPLLFVVLGLVEWVKMLRRKDGSQWIDGNWLLLVSLVWGVVVGGGYMLAQGGPPVGDGVFAYWFTVIIYGLAMGLVASGLYNVAKGLVEKLLVLNV